MPTPQPTSSLTIHLTPEHLGYLAHAFPNTDPEDALIQLLDRAKSRAIRRAEQQVRVLRPDQGESEELEKDLEESVSLSGDEVENPIGELQELCQHQQISMPVYEFEVLLEGFRCEVKAMGLRGVGEGRSKKEAKVGAAGELLAVISSN